MSNIRQIHNDIDVSRLSNETLDLISRNNLNQPQISLTSEYGNDDWSSGIENPRGVPYKFDVLNQSLQGTYISELISRYKGYYRWRLLILQPAKCYSIHSDRGDNRQLKSHYRLHIPIISDANSVVMFFKNNFADSQKGYAEYHKLLPGNSYLFNAGNLHTALNGGLQQSRIHMVGQKSKVVMDRSKC